MADEPRATINLEVLYDKVRPEQLMISLVCNVDVPGLDVPVRFSERIWYGYFEDDSTGRINGTRGAITALSRSLRNVL